MRKLTTKRPSPGTVLGAIALVVAVVGTANAAPTKIVIHKGEIAPGAVTAKSLARGAVTARKIRKGAVSGPKLAKGAVGPEALGTGAVTSPKLAKASVSAEAIAADAVTAGAIAPGSVYGGSLAKEQVVTKPIADLDADPHNGEWTASNTEVAACKAGERLLGGGFAFTNPGNREAAWLEALPVLNGETNAVTGRITTDSGGAATAEVAAVCLE